MSTAIEEATTKACSACGDESSATSIHLKSYNNRASHAIAHPSPSATGHSAACAESLLVDALGGRRAGSMDELCDKIKEDGEFRGEWAEWCGFGFKLPSVVPSVLNVPKMEGKDEARKAP